MRFFDIGSSVFTGSPFRIPALLLTTLLLGAGLAHGSDGPPAAADQAAFDSSIRPVLQQFCIKCHSGAHASAGVDLAAVTTLAALQKDQTTWRRVVKQVSGRTMPPVDAPQPSQEQRDLLAGWLRRALDSADPSLLPRDPGHVLIHRLNRTEYNNTVRDLFGVDTHPADNFPADGGGGGGFDNDADTLFVPPILMERYLLAAGDIVRKADSKRIFFVKPGRDVTEAQAAHRILSAFAERAFRRPLEDAEVARLMRLYTAEAHRGRHFEDAVRFALKSLLVSPDFLFRVEMDRHTAGAYPVSDYELASRLSYFLWSSMPDDTLFRLAGEKRLSNPAVLSEQVERMLASPKSRALSESFAGQWLRIRDLYTTSQPDSGKFPGFTPALRDDMYNETIDFFDSVVRENSSLIDLINSNYTYLNEDLAKHYGIGGVSGGAMRRVELKDDRRGGVLTMASVLTVTSYPERTSPVLRGKWVLEQILGAQVPPPPPDAGGLPADDAPHNGKTFRQRLEQHRSKPQCASCHARMDPIGFGLENFDGIGRWRTEVGGTPIDAAGVLSDGTHFSGPGELKLHILQDKDEFVRNLTEKMLAYALGRGLEPYDMPTVNSIASAVAHDGYHSRTLVQQIAHCYPFRYRKDVLK